MWTFFENGTFYSAVVDRDDTDVMWVRSRDERSAKILADWAGVDVVVRENADYLYRVSLNRETWIEYVTVQMNSAKATNFKSEVGRNVEGETVARSWMRYTRYGESCTDTSVERRCARVEARVRVVHPPGGTRLYMIP